MPDAIISPAEGRLLDVAELCQRWKYRNRQSVYNLIWANQMPVPIVRMSGKRSPPRFRLSDVVRLEQAQAKAGGREHHDTPPPRRRRKPAS